MISNVSGDDILWAARALSGEADNQPYEGKIAIGYVGLNRLVVARAYKDKHHGDHHPLFGDGTLTGVFTAPRQFSCLNDDDPNRARITALAMPASLSMSSFRDSVSAIIDVLQARAPNPVGQATHYHHIRAETPKWAVGQTPFCTVGDHVFYVGIN